MICKSKSLATRCLSLLVVFFLFASFNAGALAGAYEASLPADLSSNPDLCKLLDCREIFPAAKSFSKRVGMPPYAMAYADTEQKQLLGYVMLSTDITDTPAYSGKPVVNLIGIDTSGHYVGIKVLKHSEPILLLGIPETALYKFNQQYLGKSVKDKIEVGQNRADQGVTGVDAISGATVTVIAQNQVITTAAAVVARQVGILAADNRVAARFKLQHRRYTWTELIKLGAIQQLKVKSEQLGLPHSDQAAIEIWFGDINHPDIGQSILGELAWNNLRSRLQPHEQAIFVIRTAGQESFKGSGFVRGGIYDRIHLTQGGDTYTFRDLDYFNLYGIAAAGAPAFTESAIFILRSSSFSAAYPWKLSFLANRVDQATGARSFSNFSQDYWMADGLLESGRPSLPDQDAPWLTIWRKRAIEIALFAGLLLSVLVVFASRNYLTRRASHKNKWPVNLFKYSFWLISIFWLGFGVMAQPSITQVLTWFHAILFQWNWPLFLSDPFIFLFWIFIIVSVFLFGRGLFCGWLCPFGSLSEAIYKLAAVCGLKRWQRKLPRHWHDKLKWLKYLIFAGLLVVSLFSMGLAEVLAEIEPFKTSFLVGINHRAWPYGLFVLSLLSLSLFIERPYCKYLCPLGAALAVPSTFRWFGLRRKQDCNQCKACAKGCGSQAIDQQGRIDTRECLLCLDCMVLYSDAHACPPLVKEAKRRQHQGLATGEVAANGYFIPIYPVQSYREQIAPAALAGPDPDLQSSAYQRKDVEQITWWRWLILECIDHFWPWRKNTKSQWGILAGTGFALLLSLGGLFALTGNIASSALIAWWLCWSGYEIVLRKYCKPWVKEGPWWGRRWRLASWMDLFCYVSFKNLIVGAMLFIGLRSWSGI